jgi:RNA polymerase sigma-70 factor (ECF subfamily)
MEEVGSTTPRPQDLAGGSAAFEQLVRTHTKELLRFASKRLNDPLIAEDLVQTTFMSAWASRDRFAQQSSPRTWLFSILKNKLADHYRQVYRDPVLYGAPEADDERFDESGRWKEANRPNHWELDEAGEAEALQNHLANCLQHLPAHWRAAVEMKYLHDRDATVICQELGISPTHYWQQLHRAKLKLRDCITRQLAVYR